MQRVDAEHDLVERAGRDESDQEGVERLETELAGTDGGARVDPSGHPGGGTEHRLAAQALQGGAQRLHVPAVARREQADARSVRHQSISNDFLSIASSIAPLEKTRPVAAFTTVTCAGLKSIGSIL